MFLSNINAFQNKAQEYLQEYGTQEGKVHNVKQHIKSYAAKEAGKFYAQSVESQS